MNPLEKEIARLDPTGTKDSFTFTEKELLALLSECVEFEVALLDSTDEAYEAGYNKGYRDGVYDAEQDAA